MKLSCKEQPSLDGFVLDFIICEKFIGDDEVCLVLVDNVVVRSQNMAWYDGEILLETFDIVK